MARFRTGCCVVVAWAGVAVGGPAAWADDPAVPGADTPATTTPIAQDAARPGGGETRASAGRSGREATLAARRLANPKFMTLARMMRNVSVSFNETRLEDAIGYLREVTGADFEALYRDDRNTVGMDPEAAITLNLENTPALTALERLLDKAASEAGEVDGWTWQLGELGALQIGPKERLNHFKRIEMYDIQDLLLDLPTYNNVPEFDLSSATQSNTGGGGGGQSPFTGGNDNQNVEQRTDEEKAQEVQDILTELVEPDQWQVNGGNGATIRFWRGNLIVNAPDYVHRGVNGYPFWPEQRQQFATREGRRYVTLSTDASISDLVDLVPFKVPAAVPGTPTNPPGGGGKSGPGGKASGNDEGGAGGAGVPPAAPADVAPAPRPVPER